MAKLLGKIFGESPKTSATPTAFTIKIDPVKFNLATKPEGTVYVQLESLKQKLTKLSSNVENNLMLSIRASTKKNVELASSAFKFDEEYIRKGKFEVEYLTLAYASFQSLSEGELKSVKDARMILRELEKLAQIALNIADKTEYVQFANVQELHKDEYGLKPMGDITAEMIKKSVEAFVSGNAKHASETLVMMKEIQTLFDSAVAKIKASVNDQNITNLTGILSVIEHVKAAADISCSIATHFC
ncbi:PhoU family transcriptional regulator [Chlorobium sp. BLA1]|uniref:PhoU domain-containing protein n=1 Tax=Candidatus Chlorobium masyuteum TaxID=2716876 RepID=UPI0014211296|nr:PhoU domain-containing protein [Candidatus Chlorobium masyuteum]NHQ61167.1 PhoU family transcriptional regulator [Candidatus Chlorobium masyuteum]NTU45283.1 PhoU family transcriptional regulator [Chlorobiaceae bacterium]